MTSMTTLFHVGPGPEEFVEFNESFGSRAFLEHIWNEQVTPLKQSDLAGSQLHSAKARISKTTPPHIEFPTILRIKGKGNSYKFSGRWISWSDLAARNPLAVKTPPSLDDFIARGGKVGHGKAISPGGWLGADNALSAGSLANKAQKAMKESRKAETLTGSGSKESIYAPGVLAPLADSPDTAPASNSRSAAKHAAENAASSTASSPPAEKKKGASQIEAMLERLRSARTGLGSGASKWATAGAGIEVLKQEADVERQKKASGEEIVALSGSSEAKDAVHDTPSKGKSSRRGGKSRGKEKEGDHIALEETQQPVKSLLDRLEPREAAPTLDERVDESLDESHDEVAIQRRREKKRGRRGDKHSKESMSASASLDLPSLGSLPNGIVDEAHQKPELEQEVQAIQPPKSRREQPPEHLGEERPEQLATRSPNQNVLAEPRPAAVAISPKAAAKTPVQETQILGKATAEEPAAKESLAAEFHAEKAAAEEFTAEDIAAEGAEDTAAPANAAEESAVEASAVSPSKIVKPHINWADDDGDDDLPDFDDWGITLPAAGEKTRDPAPSAPKNNENTRREAAATNISGVVGGEGSSWRKARTERKPAAQSKEADLREGPARKHGHPAAPQALPREATRGGAIGQTHSTPVERASRERAAESAPSRDKISAVAPKPVVELSIKGRAGAAAAAAAAQSAHKSPARGISIAGRGAREVEERASAKAAAIQHVEAPTAPRSMRGRQAGKELFGEETQPYGRENHVPSSGDGYWDRRGGPNHHAPSGRDATFNNSNSNSNGNHRMPNKAHQRPRVAPDRGTFARLAGGIIGAPGAAGGRQQSRASPA